MSEHSAEFDSLADRLAAEYAFDLPSYVSDRVFRLAWENGHANGAGEVEMFYVDLADLAGDAYRAGLSTPPASPTPDAAA